MAANRKEEGMGASRPQDVPDFFVEGIDKVMEKDLALAAANVERAKIDLENHKQGRAFLLSKKAHYRQLIRDCKAGNNNYSLDALVNARNSLNVDIQATENHLSNARERIKHHGLIAKTMEANLKEYKENHRKMEKAGLLKHN